MDVGTRVYTYGATLAKVMAAAALWGVKVAVLDRPNPIGGVQVEGNLLRREFASLVGPYPLPMRHGFTLGELAGYYQPHPGPGLRPRGQSRRRAGGGRTISTPPASPGSCPPPTSPPWEGALVYPGQVLLEGTNLSEGRGTTRPFELFGAPFLEPRRLVHELAGHAPARGGPSGSGLRAHLPQMGRSALPRVLHFPCHPPLGLQAVLHHPGAPVRDPGGSTRTVRLAPAPLRVRDRAPAH